MKRKPESARTDGFITEHSVSIRERIAKLMEGGRGEIARVSRETGIRANHLGQILAGKSTLKLRHLVMLSAGLNVNLDWLLTGEGHMHDIEPAAPPVVSRPDADLGALSIDQVGKLLAAAERERLTPDERALLARYQSLPPAQRARLWALLEAGAADPPDAPPALLSEPEKRKGER